VGWQKFFPFSGPSVFSRVLTYLLFGSSFPAPDSSLSPVASFPQETRIPILRSWLNFPAQTIFLRPPHRESCDFLVSVGLTPPSFFQVLFSPSVKGAPSFLDLLGSPPPLQPPHCLWVARSPPFVRFPHILLRTNPLPGCPPWAFSLLRHHFFQPSSFSPSQASSI